MTGKRRIGKSNKCRVIREFNSLLHSYFIQSITCSLKVVNQYTGSERQRLRELGYVWAS